jgi:hypothetical protein
MTWKQARLIAIGHIRRLHLPAQLAGARVQITDYVDEDTLRFLKTDEPEITLHSQQLINQAFAREIRKRGGVVEFVPVDIAEFFAWLGKYALANTPANRAQYISWLTCPDPKFGRV